MKAPVQIDRTGVVQFGDASLSVWEEGIPELYEERTRWHQAFKQQVFSRIVQTLNRLRFTTVIPDEMLKNYPAIANNYRFSVKGDLKAELRMSGRTIELQFFQSVNTPTRPDHDGRYEYDKERIMPYPIRLEMERTRRRIRAYLCNVLAGYTFKAKEPERGLNGLTALEWVKADARRCWHYKADIDRRAGEDSSYNNKSNDGSKIVPGERVWFVDYSSRRWGTGVAHYNINNMWWVITGKYGLSNIASFNLYSSPPTNPREKCNADRRNKRLTALKNEACEAQAYERAIVLRDLLRADVEQTRLAA